jgi:hypothetical protein
MLRILSAVKFEKHYLLMKFNQYSIYCKIKNKTILNIKRMCQKIFEGHLTAFSYVDIFLPQTYIFVSIKSLFQKELN